MTTKDDILGHPVNAEMVLQNRLYANEHLKDFKNKKVLLFIVLYARFGNATKSAVSAGYSPRSARNQGSRLMNNDDILAAIDEEQKQYFKSVSSTKADLHYKMSLIMNANIHDFLSDDGSITLKNATEDQLYTISEVNMDETIIEKHEEDGDIKRQVIERKVKIKLHNRISAANFLARHADVNAFSDRGHGQGGDVIVEVHE